MCNSIYNIRKRVSFEQEFWLSLGGTCSCTEGSNLFVGLPILGLRPSFGLYRERERERQQGCEKVREISWERDTDRERKERKRIEKYGR